MTARWIQGLPGAAVATAGLAAVLWASHAPVRVNDSNEAVLRLAWSARPERVETCRQVGDDELANVPAHMRQPVVCAGAAAQYRLTITLDRRLVADEVVHAGGLRQDRWLYVFKELRVPASAADVEIRFERVTESTSPAPGQQPVSANGAAGDTIPPVLIAARRLDFVSGTVTLVTYDARTRQLRTGS
jgi:hypothetical protein